MLDIILVCWIVVGCAYFGTSDPIQEPSVPKPDVTTGLVAACGAVGTGGASGAAAATRPVIFANCLRSAILAIKNRQVLHYFLTLRVPCSGWNLMRL